MIRGAVGPSPSINRSGPRVELRWDRINSRDVIARARQIYFDFIDQCPGGAEPLGVILWGERSGRVVHETPVLLPHEQYVPMELIHPRSGQRLRSARGSRP